MAQSYHEMNKVNGHRLLIIDAVRGLGLLLILVSNIQEFALPRAGYFYPSVYGDWSMLNKVAWHLDHLFCNEKSLIIFGLVFGASIVLSGTNQSFSNRDQWLKNLRRTTFLLVIGAIHAYLVWDGDILVTLALCGLIVFPMRRQSVTRLVAMGLFFVVLMPLLVGFMNAKTGLWQLADIACFSDRLTGPPGTLTGILQNLRGTYLDQMNYRIPASVVVHTFVIPYHLLWYVSGSMCLGMALLKTGFLAGKNSIAIYRIVVASSLVFGLPLTHSNLHHLVIESQVPWISFYVSAQYEWWTALLMACGWISAIALATHWHAAHIPIKWLAAVGKMSLSNYLGQSLICTMIFYGHGLGLFGHVDRIYLLSIVIVIWIFQIGISNKWLKKFHAGPVETVMHYWMGR